MNETMLYFVQVIYSEQTLEYSLTMDELINLLCEMKNSKAKIVVC